MTQIEELTLVKEECEEVKKLTDLMLKCLKSNLIEKMFEVLIVMTHKMEHLIGMITQEKELLTEEIHIEEINEILKELIDGVENADYVLIADLLEYEMLEKINEWNTIIEQSCKNIELA